MKHIIALIFLFILLSCSGKSGMQCNESGGGGGFQASKTEDLRCLAIQDKVLKKAEAPGFCYIGPLIKGLDPGAIDPDPEKCSAFAEEAAKKCEALPPLKPEDIDQVSGSATYPNGKKVSQDGKPICP